MEKHYNLEIWLTIRAFPSSLCLLVDWICILRLSHSVNKTVQIIICHLFFKKNIVFYMYSDDPSI